ncbi:MAG: hypothetical protein AMXMBFR78_18250 [Rubrivivax sp.]
MTAADELRKLDRQAVDVLNLVYLAAELVERVEDGFVEQLPLLGATLRAMVVQAQTLRDRTDRAMVDAYAAPAAADADTSTQRREVG